MSSCGAPRVVGVIRFVASRGGHDRGVVQVVVPQRIEPEAARGLRPHEPHVLRLVLGDEDDARGAPPLPDASRDSREDVFVRAVVDALRGVEPQAVEVELANPVRGVLHDELADRRGAGPVEVDGVTPFGRVAIGEVRGENAVR